MNKAQKREVQKILEELYPDGLSVRKVVDLPNGRKKVTYLCLPYEEQEDIMDKLQDKNS